MSYYMAERKRLAGQVARETGRETAWVNGQLCFKGPAGSDQTKWERVPKKPKVPKPSVAIRADTEDGKPAVAPKEPAKPSSGPSLAAQLAKLDNF